MCLAIPGEVIEIVSDDGLIRTGIVSFAGVEKTVNLSYVPEASTGDFVIVHVGRVFAGLQPATQEEVA